MTLQKFDDFLINTARLPHVPDSFSLCQSKDSAEYEQRGGKREEHT